MIGGCNFTFKIWQPYWESNLEFFSYDETSGEFVKMIFRFLKENRGELNIGK
jgi:hypothetical protein